MWAAPPAVGSGVHGGPRWWPRTSGGPGTGGSGGSAWTEAERGRFAVEAEVQLSRGMFKQVFHASLREDMHMKKSFEFG